MNPSSSVVSRRGFVTAIAALPLASVIAPALARASDPPAWEVVDRALWWNVEGKLWTPELSDRARLVCRGFCRRFCQRMDDLGVGLATFPGPVVPPECYMTAIPLHAYPTRIRSWTSSSGDSPDAVGADVADKLARNIASSHQQCFLERVILYMPPTDPMVESFLTRDVFQVYWAALHSKFLLPINR